MHYIINRISCVQLNQEYVFGRTALHMVNDKMLSEEYFGMFYEFWCEVIYLSCITRDCDTLSVSNKIGVSAFSLCLRSWFLSSLSLFLSCQQLFFYFSLYFPFPPRSSLTSAPCIIFSVLVYLPVYLSVSYFSLPSFVSPLLFRYPTVQTLKK